VDGSGNYLIKGTTHETASRIWGKKKMNLLVEIVAVLSCPVLGSKGISHIQASSVA